MSNLEKSFIYLFFVSYFLASQVFLPFFKKSDIYPFFDWSLFSDCDTHRTFPEIEISFTNSKGERIRITNKRFHGKKHDRLHHEGLIIIRARRVHNKKAEERALNNLLRTISYYIWKDSFEYKIYASNVSMVEYAKKKSINKETLIREGVFKRE